MVSKNSFLWIFIEFLIGRTLGNNNNNIQTSSGSYSLSFSGYSSRNIKGNVTSNNFPHENNVIWKDQLIHQITDLIIMEL